MREIVGTMANDSVDFLVYYRTSLCLFACLCLCDRLSLKLLSLENLKGERRVIIKLKYNSLYVEIFERLWGYISFVAAKLSPVLVSLVCPLYLSRCFFWFVTWNGNYCGIVQSIPPLNQIFLKSNRVLVKLVRKSTNHTCVLSSQHDLNKQFFVNIMFT